MGLNGFKPITTNQSNATLTIHLISYPLIFLLHIIFSRWLGAEAYGDFSVTRSVALIGSTLALFGLDKATLKFLPVYRHTNQPSLAKGYLLYSITFIVILGGLLSLGGFLLLEWLSLNNHFVRHPVLYAAWLLLPISLVIYLVKVLASQNQSVMASILYQIALPLLSIVFLLIHSSLTDNASSFDAIAILVFSRLILIAVLCITLWRVLFSNLFSVYPDFENRAWFNLSNGFMSTALMIIATQHSGLLILEWLHPTEMDIGYYAAAKYIAAFPVIALTAIRLISLPEFSLLLEPSKRLQLKQRFVYYLKVLIAISLVASLGIILWGDSILALFGPNYSQGYTILVLFCPGYLFTMISGLTAPILQILNQKKVVFYSTALLLLLNMSLIFILIPDYGVPGVAFAFSLSIAPIALFQLCWLWQHLRETAQ